MPIQNCRTSSAASKVRRAFIPARADDLAREIGVYTERGELAVDADEKLEAYLRSTGKSQTSSPQIQVPEEQGEKAH